MGFVIVCKVEKIVKVYYRLIKGCFYLIRFFDKVFCFIIFKIVVCFSGRKVFLGGMVVFFERNKIVYSRKGNLIFIVLFFNLIFILMFVMLLNDI